MTLILRFCRFAEPAFCSGTAAALLLLSVAAATVHALKKLPDRRKSFVFLASRTPGGALVLSAEECGDFSRPLPKPAPPPELRLRHPMRHLAVLGAGGLFCAGTLLVPADTRSPENPPGKLDLSDEKEMLTARVEFLHRNAGLPEEKRAALLKELEEISRNADAGSPGRSYELLRELRRKLHEELFSQTRSSAKLLSRLTALEEAARTLSRGTENEKVGEQFARLLGKLSAGDPRLAEILKKGGFNGSPLSRKELSRLADALGADAGRLKRQLENLRNAGEANAMPGAPDPETAKEELEEFLRENVPGCDDLAESLTNREEGGGDGGAPGGAPGSGAPARGRGDAVLEFSGKTVDHGAKRVDHALRSGRRGKSEKNTRRTGLFFSGEEQKEESRPAKAGSLRGAPREDAGRTENPIHPAHRRAVKRYFDSGEKQP